MTHTSIPAVAFYHYTPAERANLAMPTLFPFLYSDVRVDPDTVAYIARYWYNYNFRGFGEIISTPGDLLRYDQALASGLLLSDSTLRQAYTPVRLTDGEINPARYGLGWEVRAGHLFWNDRESRRRHDRSQLHPAPGGISRRQTVILFDNDIDSMSIRTTLRCWRVRPS